MAQIAWYNMIELLCTNVLHTYIMVELLNRLNCIIERRTSYYVIEPTNYIEIGLAQSAISIHCILYVL